jgi:hypothetical protein
MSRLGNTAIKCKSFVDFYNEIISYLYEAKSIRAAPIISNFILVTWSMMVDVTLWLPSEQKKENYFWGE